MYEIGVVYRKDLLELFRDYRSLIVMVVMPILIYPLFLVLPAIVATKIKSDIMERSSRVAITGDFAPLVNALKTKVEHTEIELKAVNLSMR